MTSEIQLRVESSSLPVSTQIHILLHLLYLRSGSFKGVRSVLKGKHNWLLQTDFFKKRKCLSLHPFGILTFTSVLWRVDPYIYLTASLQAYTDEIQVEADSIKEERSRPWFFFLYLNYICLNTDSGKTSILVLLDLSSAFDTVDQTGQTAKLGLSGFVLFLFCLNLFFFFLILLCISFAFLFCFN